MNYTDPMVKANPQIEFATDHIRIYEDFVRDLRQGDHPPVYRPKDYHGEESMRLVCSQHPLYRSVDEYLSSADPREFDRTQRRLTAEWARFLKSGNLPVKELHAVTRVNQNVFDGICFQEGLESLRIKWLTAKKIDGISELKNLRKLFLENAPSVSDVTPITALRDLEVLILGGTKKVFDYSSLAALKNLKVLGICSYQTAVDDEIGVRELDFISEMPSLEYVDVIDVRIRRSLC